MSASGIGMVGVLEMHTASSAEISFGVNDSGAMKDLVAFGVLST